MTVVLRVQFCSIVAEKCPMFCDLDANRRQPIDRVCLFCIEFNIFHLMCVFHFLSQCVVCVVVLSVFSSILLVCLGDLPGDIVAMTTPWDTKMPKAKDKADKGEPLEDFQEADGIGLVDEQFAGFLRGAGINWKKNGVSYCLKWIHFYYDKLGF